MILLQRAVATVGRKNADTHPLNQYVWHPHYIDALAVRYWDYNTDGDYLDNYEGDQYFLHDANFNITAVMNSSSTVLERYHYSPYGEVTYLNANFTYQTPFLDNNHLYTGRERDGETGLQLNRNRFYHAQMGRWVNRDPIGYDDGPHLYEYANGVPTSFTDYTGLSCQVFYTCILVGESTSGIWRLCQYKCVEDSSKQRKTRGSNGCPCDDPRIPKTIAIENSIPRLQSCENMVSETKLFMELATDIKDCSRKECRKKLKEIMKRMKRTCKLIPDPTAQKACQAAAEAYRQMADPLCSLCKRE